jgi:hypothetical protein
MFHGGLTGHDYSHNVLSPINQFSLPCAPARWALKEHADISVGYNPKNAERGSGFALAKKGSHRTLRPKPANGDCKP